MKILQATLHQGHLSFSGSGRQCVANSVMAILKFKAKSAQHWTGVDMDSVLQDGDRLYTEITTKSKLPSEYLLLGDLPNVYENAIIQMSIPKAGLIERCETEGPFYHLQGALNSLETENPNLDGMLITLGNSTPNYTCAILREQGTVYFFDPHSRSDTGMSVGDGRATLTYHKNPSSLCLFIKHLTSSLFQNSSGVQFEVAAVKVENISDYQDIVNDHASLSEPESEYLVNENKPERECSMTDPAYDYESEREYSINASVYESKPERHYPVHESKIEKEFSFIDPVHDSEPERECSVKYAVTLSELEIECSPNEPERESNINDQVSEREPERECSVNDSELESNVSGHDVVSESESERSFSDESESERSFSDFEFDPVLFKKYFNDSDNESNFSGFDPVNESEPEKEFSFIDPVHDSEPERECSVKYAVTLSEPEIECSPNDSENKYELERESNINDQVSEREPKRECSVSDSELGSYVSGHDVVSESESERSFSDESESERSFSDESESERSFSDFEFDPVLFKKYFNDSDNESNFSGFDPVKETEPKSDFSGCNLVIENEPEKRFSINVLIDEREPERESTINDLVNNSEPERGFDTVNTAELNENENAHSNDKTDVMNTNIETVEKDDSTFINESVAIINDSFTLLDTIDLDIIENYDEELNSDDTITDPNYCVSNSYSSDSDENVPLSFVSRRNHFYKYLGNSSRIYRVNSNVRSDKSGESTIDNESTYESEIDTESETGGVITEDSGTDRGIGTQDSAMGGRIGTQESEMDIEIGTNESEADEGICIDRANILENDSSNHQNDPEEHESSKQKRGRKRLRNVEMWKSNIAKRRRNEGKSYVARGGKLKKARVMKKPCGCKCKFKCTEKFTEESREKTFHKFWSLGDVTMHRQFLTKYATRAKKNRGKNSHSNRNYSVKYMLPNLATDSVEIHRVCKVFFLNTLGISHQMIDTAVCKQNCFPGVINKDARGKTNGSRVNKIKDDLLERVREHIRSFPTVESHYCRKTTSRLYLDPNLTLQKMYNFYREQCASEDSEPVKLYKYRQVFNHEFNLGFFQPKNDLCDFCAKFENANESEKNNIEIEYNNHIRNKDLSRESKANDKMKAKTEKDLVVACFDLQQVLLTPKGFESSLYYKRRLNTYNFSIYNYENSDGYCYVWNESISGRGANEMASCVFDFIEKHSKQGKKRFIFYSDNCSSQNKNKYYMSMIWYALRKFALKSIEHKYLTAGHTQNENDSVHSTIESKSKVIPVYSTQQWAAIIRTARAGQAYFVKEMSVKDFFDFKIVSTNLKNFELDENKEKVYLSDIKIFKVTEDEPNKVFLKTDYNESTFRRMNLLRRVNLKGTGPVPDPKCIDLVNIRETFLPINRQKYDDLITLCASGIIPRPHHMFYLLLPHE